MQPEPCASYSKPLSEDLVFAGFTLGKSTINDVRQKLGATEKVKMSHTEDADEFICYVFPARSREMVVFFITGSQGGWTELTGYRLVVRSRLSAAALRKCAVTSAFPENPPAFRGLHLRGSIKEARSLLGCAKRQGNKLLFERTYHIDDPQQPYDVYDSLEVVVYGSSFVEIRFSHLPAT